VTNCAQCDGSLPIQTGPGRRRDYCSDGCRAAAQRDRDRLWRQLGQVVDGYARALIKEAK
jgi:hypothetical protein